MTPSDLPLWAKERLLGLFFTHVRMEESGCWVWQGWRVTPRRIYGGFTTRLLTTRNWLAHRLSYELHKGPIPEGLHVDHVCRNTLCVNPDHLEAVTVRENILRSEASSAQRARQTHCKRGHEFTEENTYRRKDHRNGRRMCRQCGRDRQRQRHAA